MALSTRFGSIEETLTVYDAAGYTSMTFDTQRNDAYRAGLRAAVQGVEQPVILEVGPGADAVLSGVALAVHPRSTVVAIEGNARSAASARASPVALRYGKRLTVVDGLSTQVARLVPADVVLHEVLGYFASREGAVVVAADLLRRLPQRSTAPPRWAPSAFGTFFVHALTPRVGARRMAADQSGMGFVRCRGPLDVSRSGCLEWFEFPPNGRADDLKAVQEHAITCTQPGTYNSTVFYIWAGFMGYGCCDRATKGVRTRSAVQVESHLCAPPSSGTRTTFVSAFASASLTTEGVQRATNWPNAVVWYDAPVTLAAGEALRTETCVNASAFPPRYHIRVTHESVAGQQTTVLDREFY